MPGIFKLPGTPLKDGRTNPCSLRQAVWRPPAVQILRRISGGNRWCGRPPLWRRKEMKRSHPAQRRRKTTVCLVATFHGGPRWHGTQNHTVSLNNLSHTNITAPARTSGILPVGLSHWNRPPRRKSRCCACFCGERSHLCGLKRRVRLQSKRDANSSGQH